jgi:hypothetical protein
MNKHTYSNQINRLKSCIETIKDVMVELQDDSREMDNHGDIIDISSDCTHLSIAAELIEKVIPSK